MFQQSSTGNQTQHFYQNKTVKAIFLTLNTICFDQLLYAFRKDLVYTFLRALKTHYRCFATFSSN
jgi:hypothetical protein